MKSVEFYRGSEREIFAHKMLDFIPRKGEAVMFVDEGRKTKVYTVKRIIYDYSDNTIRICIK